MAQRQFKSTDTSTWVEKFGSGAAGAITISADTADSARTGYANTTASATSGSTALTAGSGTGFAAGDLVIIHQSRNGGAGAGAWELNKISSVGGGTNWTLGYATVQAYDTTAQVYRLAQNTNITIDSTKTLTGVAWDGTKGGIVALLANGTVTMTGKISVSGIGYRNGTGGGGAGQATSGEGTSGAQASQSTANGNGGGGAKLDADAGEASGGGGAGGGAGTNGGYDNPSGRTFGVGGSVSGNAGLTLMTFGGGGGGGQQQNPSSVGTPGLGGGLILIIAKTIIYNGDITIANGTDGGSRDSGGGGGGSVLLKGQIITLGSNLITANAGVNYLGGNSSANTGVGRIHADYRDTISGTTTPTLDSTQDPTLTDVGTSGLQSRYWG